MAVDNSKRIAEIREILRNGVTSVTTDGLSMSYDLATLRRELRELMAEDETHKGRRPVASSVNLGGF